MDTKVNFKIGDMVKCVDASRSNFLTEGDVYCVLDVQAGSRYVAVNNLAPPGTYYNPSRFDLFEKSPTDPLTTQVGGNHYKEMKIQPIEYALANNLPFVEANVVKYVSRWRKKGGVADLKKARHMLDLLIAHEESNTTNV